MRKDAFFQPVSALEMPRFAGMPSFMRLPHLTMDSQEISRLDMGLVGVPWDAGTTNRPGPRHGPREQHAAVAGPKHGAGQLLAVAGYM